MKKRKKKTDNFDDYIITPYMKRIDEELIKINQKLAEINAKQTQLIRLYNRIDAWITSIYKNLAVIEDRTAIMMKMMTSKHGLRYKIIRLLNKLFRRG